MSDDQDSGPLGGRIRQLGIAAWSVVGAFLVLAIVAWLVMQVSIIWPPLILSNAMGLARTHAAPPEGARPAPGLAVRQKRGCRVRNAANFHHGFQYASNSCMAPSI